MARWLVRIDLQWLWMHELRGAIANAILGVLLFHLLDKVKRGLCLADLVNEVPAIPSLLASFPGLPLLGPTPSLGMTGVRC